MNETMVYNLRDDKIMDRCISFIRSEGMGREVRIGPIRKSRQQESYWHCCLGVISKYVGEDVETTKLRIKYSVLPLEEIRTSSGKVYLHPVSTTGLSKADYSSLIDATLMLGTELGLQMPSAAQFGLEER